jgi:hypothetical protein
VHRPERLHRRRLLQHHAGQLLHRRELQLPNAVPGLRELVSVLHLSKPGRRADVLSLGPLLPDGLPR